MSSNGRPAGREKYEAGSSGVGHGNLNSISGSPMEDEALTWPPMTLLHVGYLADKKKCLERGWLTTDSFAAPLNVVMSRFSIRTCGLHRVWLDNTVLPHRN